MSRRVASEVRRRSIRHPFQPATLMAAAIATLALFAGCAPNVAPASSSPAAGPSAPSGSPAPSQAPCEVADALRDARQLAAARGAYESILARANPSQAPDARACSFSGLMTVLDRRIEALTALEEGRTALARGERSTARSLFAKALGLDAGLTEAQDALNGLDPKPSATPNPSPFAAAIALLNAGYPKEAAAAAQDALKELGKTGQVATLPPELQHLPDRDLIGQTLAQGAWLAPLFTIGQVLAALALLGLLVFWKRRPARTLAVGAIDDSATEGHDGPTLAGGIAAELDFMRQEGAGTALGVTSGVDAPLDLPDAVTSAVPAAGLIAAVLGLFGRSPAKLAGEIGPDDGLFGRRLVLSLTHPNGSVDSVGLSSLEYSGLPRPVPSGAETKPAAGTKLVKEIDRTRHGTSNLRGTVTTKLVTERTTEREPSDPPDSSPTASEIVHLLGLAGTAWVMYQLRKPQEAELLPTADWRSYALARAGAALFENGAWSRAKQLYLDALVRDPDNRMALFNLGSLEQNTAASPAESRLVRARELLGIPIDPARPPKDREWYRIGYALGAARYSTAAAKKPNDPALWATLDDELTPAIRAGIRRRRALGSNGDTGEAVFLRVFLDASLVLLAATRWRRDIPDGPPAAINDLDALLQRLNGAAPNQLVDYVIRNGATAFVPPRVAFNVACYYADRSGDDVGSDQRREAWKWLGVALQDRRRLIAARIDPSLKQMREAEPEKWKVVTGEEPLPA